MHAIPGFKIKNIREVSKKSVLAIDMTVPVPIKTETQTGVYYVRPGAQEMALMLHTDEITGKQMIYQVFIPCEISKNVKPGITIHQAAKDFLLYVVTEYASEAEQNQDIEPMLNPKWHDIIKLPSKVLKQYGVNICELSTDIILQA